MAAVGHRALSASTRVVTTFPRSPEPHVDALRETIEDLALAGDGVRRRAVAGGNPSRPAESSVS